MASRAPAIRVISTRLIAAVTCALAAVLALTGGVAQADIPAGQYVAAGYTESTAHSVWMGFQMPAVSCAGMAKDSSVSIGVATGPYNETYRPRFRAYARGYCDGGKSHYILFTEYAKGDHQKVGLEFGLQPGDRVTIKVRVYRHHVFYYIHQQPDHNGNDLQGTLTGVYAIHPSALLLGAVAAGPQIPRFGAANLHTAVNGGQQLARISHHRWNAVRGGRMLIQASPMAANGSSYGLQYMSH